VANAIFEGADAIMLSGESAIGKYPVESVATMARIAKKIEQALPYPEILRSKRLQGTASVTDAISYATCTTAASLGINAIITSTSTGATARRVAKYRPQADVFAVTAHTEIMNKLVLVWGVYPVLTGETQGTDDMFEESLNRCLEKGYINKGDMVVLTAGSPAAFPGSTNLLKVHVVGDILLQGMGIGSKAVSGTVRVILTDADVEKIQLGDIVVCHSAHKSLVPYLDRVQALIAEEGGLTSDAAIIGLTMGLPVIVGASNATDLLADGMLVTVDTAHGRLYNGLAKVK
jgi:pyruvate kinase